MHSKKKITFIINPISGIHHKDHLPALIQDLVPADLFDIHIKQTQYAGHASLLAQEAVQDGVNYVIAVGGDGTINEVARSLIHTDTALGIIPFGSGNGLARSLDIPLEVTRAIKTITDERVIEIDYGKANEHIFFCTAGVGFDAWVSKKFGEGKHRGGLNYIKNVLLEYLNYEPRSYKIVSNGQEVTEKAFLIVCANASQYGNDAYIAPQADMQDGKLNITVIKPFNHLEAPLLSLQLFTKQIEKNSKIQSFQNHSLQIILNKPEVMHVDGDAILMEGCIQIETCAKGLKVLIPKERQLSLIEPIHQAFDHLQHQIVADIKQVFSKIRTPNA